MGMHGNTLAPCDKWEKVNRVTHTKGVWKRMNTPKQVGFGQGETIRRCEVSGIIPTFDPLRLRAWDAPTLDAHPSRKGHAAKYLRYLASIFNCTDRTVQTDRKSKGLGLNGQRARRGNMTGLLGTRKPATNTRPSAWTKELVMFYVGLDRETVEREAEEEATATLLTFQ